MRLFMGPDFDKPIDRTGIGIGGDQCFWDAGRSERSNSRMVIPCKVADDQTWLAHRFRQNGYEVDFGSLFEADRVTGLVVVRMHSSDPRLRDTVFHESRAPWILSYVGGSSLVIDGRPLDLSPELRIIRKSEEFSTPKLAFSVHTERPESPDIVFPFRDHALYLKLNLGDLHK